MAPPRHPQRRRAPAQHLAYSHPVAKAVAVKQMHSHLLDVRILAYVLAHGEPAANDLAHMAWIIGLASETAAHALGTGHPSMRRLHGALRTVHAMCLHHGYRWQADHAEAIDAALNEAHSIIVAHPDEAAKHVPSAQFLAGRIQRQCTVPADVAGAEIYHPQAANA